MKKNLVLFLIFISLSVYLQAQTHHFSFEIKSKSEISQITKIISIDNVKANKVWAYANDEEFAKFMELHYKIEELPLHENQGKVINMATTVAQMANWDKYPTYEVYVQMMNKFATDYPTLCQVVTIGNTQSGRQLLALKISDNISQNEQEPEFFYSSTMHGDETTGMILTLRLADYLLSKYNKDQSTTDIVNNTEIYITPDANPDGTYTGGNSTVSGAQRYYTNGHDPNRDFPDPDNGAHPNYTTYSQETQAMMDFATAHHFVMGANFHGGAEVYNYPWDTWSSAANINADDSWFSKLGTDYVASARILNSSYMTDVVPSGVTEGYDWYEAIGGRQDYMNYWHHFKEVTIEVSSTKTVSSDMLPTFWNYNKDALLNFIKESLNGIRGFVLNNSRQPLNSTITVLAHDKDNTQVVTDLTGNYHRPIFTGNWNLQFESTGYSNINVNSVGVTNGTTKFVDIIFGGTLSTTTFTGTITNQKNGLPLENVNIQLTGNSTYNTTTDASGNFSIADMNEGTYKITLSKTGYMSAIHYEAITTVSNIFAKSIVPFIDVNGIVTESGTGTLLEGVSIQILNSSYSASTTNASGVYTINNVTEGNYDIKASKPGYATITTNVAISTTNNIVNFELPISVAESFETAIPSGWTFTGVNWTRVNTGAYDGTYCIKSGAIANDGNSTMLVTKDLQGGNISFFYKVSSESGYDFLKFYIDGIEKGSWSVLGYLSSK